jgi:hypothetical protein
MQLTSKLVLLAALLVAVIPLGAWLLAGLFPRGRHTPLTHTTRRES